MASQASPDTTLTYGDANVDLDGAKPIEEFLDGRQRLTSADQLRIVRDAMKFVEGLYVHLPDKRASRNRLEALGGKLEALRGGQQQLDELQFHNELLGVFSSFRDLHTGYVPPAPFDKAIAFLPFEIEEYFDDAEKPRYVVASINEQLKWFEVPEDFVPGVEVTHWNGVAMADAVAASGRRNPGTNDGAQRALGLDRLTAVPLAKAPVPDRKPVTITYTSASSGRPKPLRVGWRVAKIVEPARRDPPAERWRAMAQGLDDGREAVRHLRRSERCPMRLRAKTAAILGQPRRLDVVHTFTEENWPDLPLHCEAKIFRAGNGVKYGYVRIRSFKIARHRSYLRNFARLVAEMPLGGLVLDLRDNPGGFILAAERLLQLFTPRSIAPQKGQFRITQLSRDLTRVVPEYMAWHDSIEEGLKSNGAPGEPRYSASFEVSPPAMCNDVGQRYYGPVVLITNALSYSATEIFAAGFKDHDIGPVLGTDERTGGGGANVVTHSNIRRNLAAATKAFEAVLKPAVAALTAHSPQNQAPEWPLSRPEWPLSGALPGDADLRVAIRRMLRPGASDANGGEPPAEGRAAMLESHGVERDHPHTMTLNDLLYENRDLLETASKILERRLKERGARWLGEISCKETKDGAGENVIAVEIKSEGIELLKVSITDPVDADTEPTEVGASVRADPERTIVELPWRSEKRARLLEIEGFRGKLLVAARKVRLEQFREANEKPN